MPDVTQGLDENGFGRDVLGALIDATPAPAVLLQSNGTILICNQAWRDFARQNGGDDPEYWVGANYLNTCSNASGDDADGAQETADGIRDILTGKSSQFEIVYPCHAPWARRWFKLMARPMHRVPQAAAMVIHVDITEQMLAVEALNIRERAIASVQEGICICDAQAPDMPIVHVNPGFVTITGFSREEALGQNCRFLQGPETNKETIQTIRDGLALGKPFHATIENYRKDGSLFWNHLQVAPVLDDQGTITHFVGIQNDVTERIKLEADLRAARDMAENANAAKSEFLSRVSHELRTPMNAIMGFSQLLERSRETMPLADKQAKWVEQISRGGQHLLELIDEVLDLAKVESGVISLSIERVQLDELVDSCLDMMRVTAEARNITITKTSSPNGLADIRADYTRVKQVLLNLLSNAVKYNRPEGHVDINLSPKGEDFIRLTVSDTGCGIAQTRQSQVFAPFDRLGAENTNVQGTGIGLSVTKKLVQAMNGQFGFDSQEGKGSRFYVDLPVYVENSERPIVEKPLQKPSRPAVTLGGATRTILYVEDNPTNLRLVRDILEGLGNINLVTAHTAEFALNIAESQNPALILMDIHLPGMNGTKALDCFRANEKTCNIPVIALTAQAMPRDVEKGLKAGFDDYITKPIDVDQLRRAVTKALDGLPHQVTPRLELAANHPGHNAPEKICAS